MVFLLLLPAVSADPVKRGPNWIDYEQPDGKRAVEVYTGPINYLENGTYLPIDTTIRSDADGHYVSKGIYQNRSLEQGY